MYLFRLSIPLGGIDLESFDRFPVKSIIHSPSSPTASTFPAAPTSLAALASPTAPASPTASTSHVPASLAASASPTATASPAAPTSPVAPTSSAAPASPAVPASPTALTSLVAPTTPLTPTSPSSPAARTRNVAATRNAARTSHANPTSPTAASINPDAASPNTDVVPTNTDAPSIWAAPIHSLIQEASVNNPDTSYNEREVLNDFCDVITSIGSNKLSSKIVEPEVTPTVKPARGRGRPKKEKTSLKAKPFKDDISAMLATSREIKISKDIVICRSGSQGSTSATSGPPPQDLDRLRIKNMEALSTSLKQGLKDNIETNSPFKV